MLRRLLLPAALRRMAAALELSPAAAAAALSLQGKLSPAPSPSSVISSPFTIDKSLFDKELPVVALRVPAPLCSSVIAQLRNASLLFSHPKLPAVVDDTQPPAPPPTASLAADQTPRNGGKVQKAKLILLSPSAVPPANVVSPASSSSSVSPSLPPALSSLIATYGLVTVPHTVQLSFASHTLEQVLSALLPASVPPPSSFTTVGHIAHLNLLPCHLPYRHVIGAAIISCCAPVLRSVVNKTSFISDEYRVSPLELIAGDADLNAEVRESGCVFRFDYSRVYWNSRLSTEHQRIAALVRDDESVVDMFAGCGPFVIPIARRRSVASASAVAVFANDKNSSSYASLVANVALNHLTPSVVHCYCRDAREFITAVVRPALLTGSLQQVDHVIMNLPAQALEFIDCLHGLYQGVGTQRAEERRAAQERPEPRLPLVHVYCFSKEEGEAGKVRDVMQRAESMLGVGLGAPLLSGEKREEQQNGGRERKRKRLEERLARAEEAKDAKSDTAAAAPAADRWSRPLLHFVRNVAPNKDMLCLSFRLPADVAYGTVNRDKTAGYSGQEGTQHEIKQDIGYLQCVAVLRATSYPRSEHRSNTHDAQLHLTGGSGNHEAASFHFFSSLFSAFSPMLNNLHRLRCPELALIAAPTSHRKGDCIALHCTLMANDGTKPPSPACFGRRWHPCPGHLPPFSFCPRLASS